MRKCINLLKVQPGHFIISSDATNIFSHELLLTLCVSRKYHNNRLHLGVFKNNKFKKIKYTHAFAMWVTVEVVSA